MSESSSSKPRDEPELSHAAVHRRRWPARLAWLSAIAALAVGGGYLYRQRAERGPLITIVATEAGAIEPGKSVVRAHGVEIGKVDRVTLTDDRARARIAVRLKGDAWAYATRGSQFWIVRPELQGGTIRGLGTVVDGPYLEAATTGGEPATEFVALDRAPNETVDGLRFTLIATQRGQADIGTPIYYRGIRVGNVESARLAPDATLVELRGVIDRRYAPLARINSRFWFEATADVSGNVFSGIDVKLGSIQTLLSGGINFASPDDPLEPAAVDDSRFVLFEKPDPAWAKWSPAIELPRDESTTRPASNGRTSVN